MPSSEKIFVVHGHDEALREAVARFLDKLDLEPIILHEQPEGGRTLIEKFEDYADVDYAIVLVTADDVGKKIEDDEAELKPRARQNVILGWGYFMGRKGRDRVAVVYAKDVERPSDVDGVAYIPADDSWRLRLVKELRHAGYDVDANRIV